MKWFDTMNTGSLIPLDVVGQSTYDMWFEGVRLGRFRNEWEIAYENGRIIIIVDTRDQSRFILGIKES